MKKIARIFVLVLAALLLGGITAGAATVPDPDPELLYVTDNAGVLSDKTEQDIAARNDILYAATGAQFAILTIDHLPAGYDSESYCYEVFNAWGIGSAEKNNGILLLLVPNEGRFWMVTGTGLQSHLSGGVLSDLLDIYLVPDFDAGRYDEGVTALFDAVWLQLEDIYGPIDAAAPDYPVYSEPGPMESAVGSFIDTVTTFIILFIIIAVIIMICSAARPGRRYYTGKPTPPPPSPGQSPYYRTYRQGPTYTGDPWGNQYPRRPPTMPPRGGYGGFGTGGFGGSSRPTSRPSGGFSRPSGSFGSSRPSRPSSSFGGSRPSSRPSGGSRSFGGGRSHGGGGGRR